MKYAAIKDYDIANGPGVRVSLFVSGCKNHCHGCFQPETWDFDYGDDFGMKTIYYILEAMDSDHIQGLTILGGDPMEIENQPAVKYLVSEVRKKFGDKKDIWLYTGYVYEINLVKDGTRWIEGVTDELLDMIDILVDGPFIERRKDLTLEFRGSSNQRLLSREDRERVYEELWS